MTLRAFESAIKKYIPNFHIREAGYGDVVGAFVGSDYLFRLNKGEQHLMSFKKDYVYKEHGVVKSNRRRGRMQALQMLVNMRWLNSRQAQAIMWGINEN